MKISGRTKIWSSARRVLVLISCHRMMGYNDVLAVAVGFILLCLTWIYLRKPKNFPPGPLGIPLIGYFPFLGKYPYETFVTLSEKYGNIFSIPLGQQLVVVLNDWTAIKEAFVNQSAAFNGRMNNVISDRFCNRSDIILSDGPGWRQRRQLTFHHLRQHGVGTSVMESIIMEEIYIVCDNLEAKGGEPVIANKSFIVAFVNIIYGVTAGKRFDKEDKIINEFTAMMKVLFEEITNTNPLFFMPYLRFFSPKKYQEFLRVLGNQEQMLLKEISEHEATYRDGHVRDVIDAFLAEIYKMEAATEKPSLSFTRNNILQVMKNLFNAGTDTNHNTVLWGLLYMATRPDIQMKVHEELDAVVGPERLPTYADKSLLRYTRAVLLEIYRYSSIVPLAIIHTTMAATTLFGFTLPERTLVLPNLWAVHHDPDNWKDPHVFNPERFLNERGEVVVPEYLIPFSVGGRICLGENLAKMTTFLFFSCLLHRFTVSFPSGVKPPSLKPLYKITLSPKTFSLIFKRR